MSGSTETTLLLVDGAMLSGSASAQLLGFPGQGLALYADLGQAASSVGPWVLPYPAAMDLKTLPLPDRLGVSVVQAACAPAALHQHLRSLRTVTMEDGQSFYLRLADTRALEAMSRAWAPRLLARIKGPITHWKWVDRRGNEAEFAPDMAVDSGPFPLLSLSAFEALVAASEADHMAAELQALREPWLIPVQQAQQFTRVEQALDWCTANGATSWQLRRAVARQSVASDGACLGDASFSTVVEAAQRAGDSGSVDAWLLRPNTGERVPEFAQGH